MIDTLNWIVMHPCASMLIGLFICLALNVIFNNFRFVEKNYYYNNDESEKKKENDNED